MARNVKDDAKLYSSGSTCYVFKSEKCNVVLVALPKLMITLF